MKRATIFVALALFAGNLCAVSAAQPLTEEQARAVIAPWYGLFNVATRGDVRTVPRTGPDGGLRNVLRLFAE